MRTCSKCGREIQSTRAKFCADCRHDVRSETAAALADVDGLQRRIEGLVRANADLKGEIKILKAKITGQRAVIRQLQECGK